jgi:N-acetylmuramoyl-L-alanine amidase
MCPDGFPVCLDKHLRIETDPADKENCMASSNKQTKRKLRPQAVALIYTLCACLVFFLLYSTVFAAAYQSPEKVEQKEEENKNTDNTGNTDDTSQNDDSTDASSQEEEAASLLTDYPDQGETVATVLLDAGHGGFDGGNTSEEGDLEKNINLQFARYVQKALESTNPNIEVKMIRTSDDVDWADNEWDDLTYRVEQQTATGADYYFSFHCNSFTDSSVKGYSFYVNEGDTAMDSIASLINANLEKINFSTYFGTVTTDQYPLQVVSLSPIHSMLMELAFMSNPEDLALLKDDATLKAAAEAVAAAISDYIMQNPDPADFVNPNLEEESEENTDLSSEESENVENTDSAEGTAA